MVKIKREEDKIKVYTDYSSAFVERARTLNGKWNRTTLSWDFDIDDEDEVKNLLLEIYKEDGETECERVSVMIDLNHPTMLEQCRNESYLVLCGINIINRNGRDYDVKLGTSVVCTKGTFSGSGGSAANPKIGSVDDIELKIKNVPRAWAEALMEKYGDEYIKIKEKAPTEKTDEDAYKESIVSKMQKKISDIKEGKEESLELTMEECSYLLSILK